jgi:hypothetical protein
MRMPSIEGPVTVEVWRGVESVANAGCMCVGDDPIRTSSGLPSAPRSGVLALR